LAGGVGSHREDRVGAMAVQVVWASRQAREYWASGLGARRAGTGVAEGGGAAAGGGRARLHPGPWPWPAGPSLRPRAWHSRSLFRLTG